MARVAVIPRVGLETKAADPGVSRSADMLKLGDSANVAAAGLVTPAAAFIVGAAPKVPATCCVTHAGQNAAAMMSIRASDRERFFGVCYRDERKRRGEPGTGGHPLSAISDEVDVGCLQQG
jgi:hypothetical protein